MQNHTAAVAYVPSRSVLSRIESWKQQQQQQECQGSERAHAPLSSPSSSISSPVLCTSAAADSTALGRPMTRELLPPPPSPAVMAAAAGSSANGTPALPSCVTTPAIGSSASSPPLQAMRHAASTSALYTPQRAHTFNCRTTSPLQLPAQCPTRPSRPGATAAVALLSAEELKFVFAALTWNADLLLILLANAPHPVQLTEAREAAALAASAAAAGVRGGAAAVGSVDCARGLPSGSSVTRRAAPPVNTWRERLVRHGPRDANSRSTSGEDNGDGDVDEADDTAVVNSTPAESAASAAPPAAAAAGTPLLSQTLPSLTDLERLTALAPSLRPSVAVARWRSAGHGANDSAEALAEEEKPAAYAEAPGGRAAGPRSGPAAESEEAADASAKEEAKHGAAGSCGAARPVAPSSPPLKRYCGVDTARFPSLEEALRQQPRAAAPHTRCRPGGLEEWDAAAERLRRVVDRAAGSSGSVRRNRTFCFAAADTEDADAAMHACADTATSVCTAPPVASFSHAEPALPASAECSPPRSPPAQSASLASSSAQRQPSCRSGSVSLVSHAGRPRLSPGPLALVSSVRDTTSGCVSPTTIAASSLASPCPSSAMRREPSTESLLSLLSSSTASAQLQHQRQDSRKGISRCRGGGGGSGGGGRSGRTVKLYMPSMIEGPKAHLLYTAPTAEADALYEQFLRLRRQQLHILQQQQQCSNYVARVDERRHDARATHGGGGGSGGRGGGGGGSFTSTSTRNNVNTRVGAAGGGGAFSRPDEKSRTASVNSAAAVAPVASGGENGLRTAAAAATAGVPSFVISPSSQQQQQQRVADDGGVADSARRQRWLQALLRGSETLRFQPWEIPATLRCAESVLGTAAAGAGSDERGNDGQPHARGASGTERDAGNEDEEGTAATARGRAFDVAGACGGLPPRGWGRDGSVPAPAPSPREPLARGAFLTDGSGDSDSAARQPLIDVALRCTGAAFGGAHGGCDLDDDEEQSDLDDGEDEERLFYLSSRLGRRARRRNGRGAHNADAADGDGSGNGNGNNNNNNAGGACSGGSGSKSGRFFFYGAPKEVGLSRATSTATLTASSPTSSNSPVTSRVNSSTDLYVSLTPAAAATTASAIVEAPAAPAQQQQPSTHAHAELLQKKPKKPKRQSSPPNERGEADSADATRACPAPGAAPSAATAAAAAAATAAASEGAAAAQESKRRIHRFLQSFFRAFLVVVVAQTRLRASASSGRARTSSDGGSGAPLRGLSRAEGRAVAFVRRHFLSFRVVVVRYVMRSDHEIERRSAQGVFGEHDDADADAEEEEKGDDDDDGTSAHSPGSGHRHRRGSAGAGGGAAATPDALQLPAATVAAAPATASLWRDVVTAVPKTISPPGTPAAARMENNNSNRSSSSDPLLSTRLLHAVLSPVNVAAATQYAEPPLRHPSSQSPDPLAAATTDTAEDVEPLSIDQLYISGKDAAWQPLLLDVLGVTRVLQCYGENSPFRSPTHRAAAAGGSSCVASVDGAAVPTGGLTAHQTVVLSALKRFVLQPVDADADAAASVADEESESFLTYLRPFLERADGGLLDPLSWVPYAWMPSVYSTARDDYAMELHVAQLPVSGRLVYRWIIPAEDTDRYNLSVFFQSTLFSFLQGGPVPPPTTECGVHAIWQHAHARGGGGERWGVDGTAVDEDDDEEEEEEEDGGRRRCGPMESALVHCSAGMHRSCGMAIAFLLWLLYQAEQLHRLSRAGPPSTALNAFHALLLSRAASPGSGKTAAESQEGQPRDGQWSSRSTTLARCIAHVQQQRRMAEPIATVQYLLSHFAAELQLP